MRISVEPIAKRLLATASIAVVWIIALPIVHRAVYEVPKLIYAVKSRSIRTKCAHIQAGMDSVEVVEVFSQGPVPSEQALLSNRLVFGNSAATCYVDLDANGRVTKARLDRPLWEY